MTAFPRALSTHAGGRPTGVGAFYAGAFLWTWAFWIPAALLERGALTLPVSPLALQILGGLGPMGAALAVAVRREGRAGVGNLFRQLRLRGLRRTWVLAGLAVGFLDLVPALVYLAGPGSLPPGIVGQVAVMPVHFLFVASVGGGLDEEMGWRGFALPRMQELMSPVLANLLLGVLWACWHLPLWLSPDSSQAATPFVVYLLTLVGQSFVIGYLYNSSGGSLLVAVLAHSAADVADGLRFAVLDDPAWALRSDLIQMAAMTAAAFVLICVTRGRLGLPPGVRSVAAPGHPLTAVAAPPVG